MRVLKKPWQNCLLYLLFAVLFYIGMNIFFINIGEDMSPSNYLSPFYLPGTLLALFLIQYATGRNLFARKNLLHLAIGLTWCIVFPLLYSWSYDKNWYISLIRNDFLFGTGLFVFLTGLEELLCLCKKHSRKIALLFAFLDLLCLLIPLAEISYYMIFQHCLTPDSLMALYMTNPRESIDFIQAKVGLKNAAAILFAFLLFLFVTYRLHSWKAQRAKKPSPYQKCALLSLVLLLGMYLSLFLFPETSILSNWSIVTQYVHDTQEYNTNYPSRFQGLKLNTPDTLAKKAPGTVIIVIGESASRNYMKAYTPQFPYDDTPWLNKKMSDPNFVVFRNAYSCWTQTVQVLQRALTEQSQYNDKKFFESTSILDVAKKAGYKTYWFSNQGRYGQYDGAITMVAKTADHAEWMDDTYDFTDKYDGTLLKALPQVDPTKNNFIVIHIMGSHIYYNNRYPSEFSKWKSEHSAASVTNIESYANSILYTDSVLQQIYQYGKDHLNLQAMVYFSDHGEDVNISHNPDVFQFDMARIPMFVYLSPQYQATMSLQAASLKNHERQFFTNDMLYDTVCGILDAPSNHYDPGQDFASPQYRFTLNNLTTMFGQHKLTEDPYLQQK